MELALHTPLEGVSNIPSLFDNKAARQRLSAGIVSMADYEVVDRFTALRGAVNTRTQVRRVPGLSGIRDNEMVDQLAKEGAEMPPPPGAPETLSFL